MRAATVLTATILALALTACGGADDLGSPDAAGQPEGEEQPVTGEEGGASDDGLDCPTDEREDLVIDYMAGAPGIQGEPVEAAAEWLGAAIEPTDELLPAPPGSPDVGDGESVAVRRDGATIGYVFLMPAQDGGWLVTGTHACPGMLAAR